MCRITACYYTLLHVHVFSSEWNLSLPFPFYYPSFPSFPPILYRPLSELLTNSTFNVNYQFGRAKRTLLHSAAKWVDEWGTFPPTGCHDHHRYITVYFKQTIGKQLKNLQPCLYVHAWRACVVVVLKFSSCMDPIRISLSFCWLFQGMSKSFQGMLDLLYPLFHNPVCYSLQHWCSGLRGVPPQEGGKCRHSGQGWHHCAPLGC